MKAPITAHYKDQPDAGTISQTTSENMNVPELQASFRQLMTRQRTGSLATLSNQGWPYVSMTPFAIDTAAARFIIHVSELAAHTRYLLQRPQASFMVCTSEVAGEPVQALSRVSFQVEATDLARGSEAWESARDCYVKRFPDFAFMVEFKDFHLFTLEILRARQVSGFGSAKTVPLADMRQWLQTLSTD